MPSLSTFVQNRLSLSAESLEHLLHGSAVSGHDKSKAGEDSVPALRRLPVQRERDNIRYQRLWEPWGQYQSPAGRASGRR